MSYNYLRYVEHIPEDDGSPVYVVNVKFSMKKRFAAFTVLMKTVKQHIHITITCVEHSTANVKVSTYIFYPYRLCSSYLIQK